MAEVAKVLLEREALNMAGEDGIGTGGIMLGFGAVGLYLKVSARAEREALIKAYADVLDIAPAEAERQMAAQPVSAERIPGLSQAWADLKKEAKDLGSVGGVFLDGLLALGDLLRVSLRGIRWQPRARRPCARIRRLTHQEAWSALRQGRYLEACRERVQEAEAAAEGRSARVQGK